MKLIAAPWAIAHQILPILQKQFPATLAAYAELKECEELQRLYPEVKRTLLIPDGQSDPHLTFAIIVPEHRNQLFFECSNPKRTEAAEFGEALLNCEEIKWSDGVITGPSPARLYPILDYILNSTNMVRYEIDDETTSFYIPEETALSIQYTVPLGTYLRTLKEEHASAINDVYPFGKTEQTLKELKDALRFREGIGLFLKETDELVAWVVPYEYGGPGALQVSENHKRRGYGEVVLRAMTLQLARRGYSPKAYVAIGNTPSEQLFTKLGYIKDSFEKWCYIIKN